MNTIIAQPRDPSSKAKQLRRSGLIPCIISGMGQNESCSIQIDLGSAQKIKRTKRNGSKLNIQLGEKTIPVLIKNIEYNSVNDEIVHISFLVLNPEKIYNSIADIDIQNRDSAEGIAELIQSQVPHAAKPQYLLDTVKIDLSGMKAGTVITIGDIPEFCSENIELQADKSNIILRIRDKVRATFSAEK